MINQDRNNLYFWLAVLASTCAVLLASCSTRKVAIDTVKKDSLSQIYTKTVTKEEVETKNDITIDEFTITPLDTCKDIVVNGVVYKNVTIKYKKTKDNTLRTEKKIESKTEDKRVVVREKEKKKETERKSVNWVLIVIISIVITLWLNKHHLLSLLRKI